MKEFRCACGQLLFKGDFIGSVEIKCRRCKKIKYIERIMIKESKNENIAKNKNSIK